MAEERLVRIRAVVRQVYGGRLLMPGDVHEKPVPERIARGLIANHFFEAADDEPKPKRRYMRRDLRAEK